MGRNGVTTAQFAPGPANGGPGPYPVGMVPVSGQMSAAHRHHLSQAPGTGSSHAPFPDTSRPPLLGGALPQTSAAGYAITRYNTRVMPLTGEEEEAAGAVPTRFKTLSTEDEGKLLDIMRRDDEYQRAFEGHQNRTTERLREHCVGIRAAKRVKMEAPSRNLSFHWWERASEDDIAKTLQTHQDFQIVYPADRRKREAEAAEINRSAKLDSTLVSAATKKIAESSYDPVPIRLEIDIEPLRLRDTFIWNASDDAKLVDAFAHALCDDLGLPANAFAPMVREAVDSQLQEHGQTKALSSFPGPSRAAAEGSGLLQGQGRNWWRRIRDSKNMRGDLGGDEAVGGQPKVDDLRIQIKVSCAHHRNDSKAVAHPTSSTARHHSRSYAAARSIRMGHW